jgi:hypothetical protein
LAIAVLAWFAASLATHQVTWTTATALTLNLIVYLTGFALLSTTPSREPRATPPQPRRRLDLPVRAVAVALFVSTVVAVSSILGATATGIAAVFPISLISLIVIVRPRIGAAATAVFAASALRGMLGFGLTLLTLHLAIPPLGTPAALLTALLVSALWSVALLLLKRVRLQPRTA